MAKLRAGIDDLVKLLEMVNEREENGEEFTEEELRQAFIPEEEEEDEEEEDGDNSSGDITMGSVSIETIDTNDDFSSPIKNYSSPSPLNLTNGKTTTTTTTTTTTPSPPIQLPPSPSPTTSSSSSSSSLVSTNQPNGNQNNSEKINKDNITVTINPENTKDKEKEETITCNGPIILPSNLNDVTTPTTTTTITNDDNVNCNNQQVNGKDDRSVFTTTTNGKKIKVKDEDKLLSDSGDDNVTNDSPYFTFSMVNHSTTKDLSGKNLYHCYVCNAIYRHSFSLKRHFIRTHINYAFLCDADLANCSITLALSESHLAWISRLKSSTTSTCNGNESVSIDSGHSSTFGGCDGNSPSLVNANIKRVNSLACENYDSTSILPSSSSSSSSSSSVVITETATYQPPKSKGLYCCHACVMFFDRINFLRAHLRESHRSSNSDTLEAVRLPCHRCDMTFIQRAQLIRHLNSAHGLVTSQPTTSMTTSSSSSSSTAAATTVTTINKSNTVKGIKRKKGSSSFSTTSSSSSSGCDQKNSSSEEKCDDEEDDEDDNSSSSQERNCLNCAHCPYKCKSSEQLKKHISSRHPITTFKCAYCKIQFKIKKQLIDHLSSIHGKSLVANSRLLKSMSVQLTSSSSPSSTTTTPATTSSSTSSSSQPFKNTISTRSLKRRRTNRRGANYDEDNYDDDLFECHECFAKFHIATELLKHAETVHNPSRTTRSCNNNASYRDESAFYQSLAQKISENLLFYVDGKPKVQPDNDYNNNTTNNTTNTNTTTTNTTNNNNKSTSDKPNESKTSSPKLLNLQDYNFPPGFKLYADDDDCNVDENHQKLNTINGDLTIYSIAQVNSNDNNLIINMSDNNNTIKEMEPEKDNNNTTTTTTTTTAAVAATTTTTDTNNGLIITNNQSTSIINVKPGTLVFICNACGNYFLTLNDFDEHEINNHPNVFCSYTEIEYNPSIPVDIFRWHSYSPHGLLKSCKVPMIASSSSEPSIKCTKCHNKFSTATDLYQHILDCSSKSKRKLKPPRKTSSSILPVTSSTSSSPSTEPPKTNAIPAPNAITTINDNQNIKPKSTTLKSTSSSPQPIIPITSSSSSSSPIPSTTATTTTETTTTATNTDTTTITIPPTSSSISMPSSSSTLSSSSSSSSTSTQSSCSSSSPKKAQPTPIISSPSTRRSSPGQTSRPTISSNSILASLSYNTRSAKKRKNDDTEIDLDFGLSLVKKRIRKVRYHCTNCSEIFSHHLTFAKHRNNCLKPSTGVKEEKTVSSNSNKTKNSDTPNSSSSSSTPPITATSSSSSGPVKGKLSLERFHMLRRLAMRNGQIVVNQNKQRQTVTRQLNRQIEEKKRTSGTKKDKLNQEDDLSSPSSSSSPQARGRQMKTKQSITGKIATRATTKKPSL